MSNLESPLVSVIIPTFNRVGTIRRAVESVLSQDYSNLELIVVDDGSNDGTFELLSGLDDTRLRLIRHSVNRGVSAARNTGIENAKGIFVAFQDSDDEWLFGKISEQVEALVSAGPDYILSFCTKIVYGRDETYHRGKRRVACVPSHSADMLTGNLFTKLVSGNFISTQTILVYRKSLDAIGGFDQRLKTSEEWFLVLKLSMMGKFVFTDEPLVNTYVQTDSISLLGEDSLFSQIVVSNWLRRVGVTSREQSDRIAFIGQVLIRKGHVKRGYVFLSSSILADPFNMKVWARALNTLLFLLGKHFRAVGRRK